MATDKTNNEVDSDDVDAADIVESELAKEAEEDAEAILDEMADADRQDEQSKKTLTTERGVPADYEPEDDEYVYKDRELGGTIAVRHEPQSESKRDIASVGRSRERVAEFFDEGQEQDRKKGSSDTSPNSDFEDVYADWIAESETSSDSEYKDEPDLKNSSASANKLEDESEYSQTTPAERIEDRVQRNPSSLSPRVYHCATRNTVSDSRNQAIDDDLESPTSVGHITPAETRFDPSTDAHGNKFSYSDRKKYERLRRHHENRTSEYNDTENAITKVRECDRVAGALDLSSHQRSVLTRILFDIDMGDFGSFSTSQIVLFATYALLRSEYMRHHLSYRPGDEQYPQSDPTPENKDEIKPADILNLSNHADDFEMLIEAENRATMDNAPKLDMTVLKRQARKITELNLVPDPKRRYES